MIQAVLFDLDGTLYDRDETIQTLAREQFAAFKDRMSHVGEARFLDRFLALDEHGYSSRSDLYRRLAEEFDLDDEMAVELERHFWAQYSRHSEVSDDTWTTLRTLRAAGMKLGVVTN